MSVLLETSKGDLVIDLYTDDCPNTCKNFLKLCKIKYYNNCLFHNIVRNFIAQTGDPTGTGKGGDSIYGVLYGEQARFFEDEIRPHLRHRRKGTVAMAGAGRDMNASQFYITTAAELDSLDEKHTVFGEVSEGADVLDAINDAICDGSGCPLQNIRVRHTIVLDDPFPDPPQLAAHVPEASPPPAFATDGDRLEDDWAPTEDTRPAEVIEEEGRRLEAEKRAEVLEMVGDLPAADAAPPTNQIFVCKLNPVTTEEDLEIIFSRFGSVTACDIIRDYKTGDSLCYAFITFDSDAAAEAAFFKMDNVLVDDRRIHVDFSQSMHHLWRQFKTFGKAGSAALAQEAAGKEGRGSGGGRRGLPGGAQLELKPGAAQGLYAGPAAGGRRGYEMVHEEATGPSGRGGRPEQPRHGRAGGDGGGGGGRRARSRSRTREQPARERGRDADRDRHRDRDRDGSRHHRGRSRSPRERRRPAEERAEAHRSKDKKEKRDKKEEKKEKKEKREKERRRSRER